MQARMSNSATPAASAQPNQDWDPTTCRNLYENTNLADTVDLHMINFLLKLHCRRQHYSLSYLKFTAAYSLIHDANPKHAARQLQKLAEAENAQRVFRFDLTDFQVPLLTMQGFQVVSLQNVAS